MPTMIFQEDRGYFESYMLMTTEFIDIFSQVGGLVMEILCRILKY